MYHSRYDDDDDNQLTYAPRLRAPCWYRPESRPCACQPMDARLSALHEGYSDSTYREWTCKTCGHVWCDYLEG